MFLAYCLFLKNALSLCIWQCFHLFDKRPVAVLRNIILLLLLPVIIGLLHIHWVFFILDEILFFTYRKTKIKRPLFIIGIPRSGTTFLQRTLAYDTQFTTTTLFDCIFTPSITQRYLAQGIKWIFKPITKYVHKFTPRFFNNMEDIHKLGLQEPEEDFFMLITILSCFIQMTIFPKYPATWKLAQFDQCVSKWEKNIIMNFYKNMVKKHLYFYGKNKTYLAKNPSYTSWIKSLHLTFDHPVIVACIRQPEKTVPSQISSLQPIFNVTKHNIHDQKFINNIHSMLLFYYKYIEKLSKPRHIQPIHVVEMDEIKMHLYDCLIAIYQLGQYELNEELNALYINLAQKNTQFKSKHKYNSQLHCEKAINLFESIWPMSVQARLINLEQTNA